MEGPLSKWTNVVQGWQYRWFALTEDAVIYYTSKDKMMRRQQRGCMRLRGAIVGIDGENQSLFTLTQDGKVFHLQGENERERNQWVNALDGAIRRCSGMDFETRLIGSGAYGHVYELVGHKPPAALKLVRDPTKFQKIIVERETETLKRLNHQNVVQYFRCVELKDQLGIVMEYCQFGVLSRLIFDPEVIYTMKTVLCYGEQLFDALDYMYQQHRVIHRDIKPDNIFLTNDWTPKIGDFGLTKVIEQTATGTFAGTSRYMSPPQFDGSKDFMERMETGVKASHRNDVYSLGLTMWEMIERRRVFSEYSDDRGFNRELFLIDIIRKRFVVLEKPACQKEIGNIIARCTNFVRSSRPNAQNVASELRKVREELLFEFDLELKPFEEEGQRDLIRPIGFDGTTKRAFVDIFSERSVNSTDLSPPILPIWSFRKDESTLIDILKHYKKRLIGRGAFGEVFEVVGYIAPAAIKYIHVDSRAIDIAKFESELAILKDMKHDNIVGLLRSDFIKEKKQFGILMEFCKRGTLRQAISNTNLIYSIRTVIWWGIQLFGALDYMIEKHKIIHRDIKPENIFVHHDFTLKIGDFGLVKIIEQTSPGTFVGTQRYMSPIVFNKTTYQRMNSHRNDVYSSGLVMWETIERKKVYSEYERENLFRHEIFIVDITLTKFTKLTPPTCPRKLQEIIEKCVNLDFRLRPIAYTVCEELKQMEKNFDTFEKSPKEERQQTEILRPIGFDGTNDQIPIARIMTDTINSIYLPPMKPQKVHRSLLISKWQYFCLYLSGYLSIQNFF